jgi:hypothetical protein
MDLTSHPSWSVHASSVILEMDLRYWKWSWEHCMKPPSIKQCLLCFINRWPEKIYTCTYTTQNNMKMIKRLSLWVYDQLTLPQTEEDDKRETKWHHTSQPLVMCDVAHVFIHVCNINYVVCDAIMSYVMQTLLWAGVPPFYTLQYAPHQLKRVVLPLFHHEWPTLEQVSLL